MSESAQPVSGDHVLHRTSRGYGIDDDVIISDVWYGRVSLLDDHEGRNVSVTTETGMGCYSNVLRHGGYGERVIVVGARPAYVTL